jgi:integrase
MQIPRAKASPHGFRSSFKDWALETTSFPNELSEAALAHISGDATERAYRRGDQFKRRRELMEAWARFCEPQAAANVVTLLA